MRTLAEIKNALPQLSAEELMRVEVTLHRIRRERKQGIIFDDTYGVWTEDDQASVAAEAWSLMEVLVAPASQRGWLRKPRQTPRHAWGLRHRASPGNCPPAY